MPELPEVETIRAGLDPLVRGATFTKVLVRRPDLRFALPPNLDHRLTGRRIEKVGRRAKYLLFELDDGAILLSHLGMTGNYRTTLAGATAQSPSRHDHVVFQLQTPQGGRDLIYSDPRRFGYMELIAPDGLDARFARLGPEPLGNHMNALTLAAALAKRKGPIKTALLDQSVVAGLGNIYVCEALWRARVSPSTGAADLVRANGAPTARLERLSVAIRDVLADAIAAGGSTLRDYKNAEGETGYFQHSFDVYGRENEPCRRPGCSGQIARIVQSGRSSFYCPQCQKK